MTKKLINIIYILTLVWAITATYLLWLNSGVGSGTQEVTEEIYEEYHPTFDKNIVKIMWVRDEEKVNKALRKYEEENYYGENSLMALAVWNNKKCTVYALEPQGQFDAEAMDTLGHEMLHCFKGSYHD